MITCGVTRGVRHDRSHVSVPRTGRVLSALERDRWTGDNGSPLGQHPLDRGGSRYRPCVHVTLLDLDDVWPPLSGRGRQR